MKKAIATIALYIGLVSCTATVTPTPEITIPTVTPEPIVEPLERKLIGVKFMSNEKVTVIGLAYDLNNDNLPDMFEAYIGHYHSETDWMHLHQFIETIYKGDDL